MAIEFSFEKKSLLVLEHVFCPWYKIIFILSISWIKFSHNLVTDIFWIHASNLSVILSCCCYFLFFLIIELLLEFLYVYVYADINESMEAILKLLDQCSAYNVLYNKSKEP